MCFNTEKIIRIASLLLYDQFYNLQGSLEGEELTTEELCTKDFRISSSSPDFLWPPTDFL